MVSEFFGVLPVGGVGRVALLVHGVTSTGVVWRDTVEVLLSNGFDGVMV